MVVEDGLPLATIARENMNGQLEPEKEKRNEENKPNQTLDEKEQIVNAIGGWGKWQLQRCILIVIIIWLPASFHLLNMVYYTAPTKFSCSRPANTNFSIEEWQEFTHKVKNVTSANETVYDPCWIKNPVRAIAGDFASDEYVECTDWEFDRSFWKNTIIMEFKLVCEREKYIKFTQQVTFFGLMCGVLCAGLISDRFGRRRSMLLLLFMSVISGTLSSFSPNYTAFLVSVFFTGFSSLGYGTVMYVWMMEHVSGRHKTILGACPHYCFGFWGLMTALISYLHPSWRDLQLIFSVPCIVLAGAYFLLPESPRWLLAQGRREEAEVLCRNIARVNGRELDPDFCLTVKEKSESSSGGFLTLFRYPNLCRKTLICYYLWFSTALIYYGLTLNSNSLGASLFLYQSVGKILEFPTITIVIMMLLKSGRRITLMIFYSLGGVCLILTMFVPLNTFPYEWPIVVLNLSGRVCAIGTLAVCYIYSSEIFPTVVRNVGLGSSSLWARVGPMVAPFIASLKVYDERIPTTVFGIIALLAACLVTFLPETSNSPLPDTIQESEDAGQGDTFWSWLRNRKRQPNVEKET